MENEDITTAVELALNELPKLEALVLRLKFGIGAESAGSNELISHALGISIDGVERLAARAFRMLKQPMASASLEAYIAQTWREEVAEPTDQSELLHPTASHIQISALVTQIKKLEPALIAHLQKHSSDLLLVDWSVMEHLVAELLAGIGFSDVTRVGANAKTSADIFAGFHHLPSGVKQRLFVEVKRVKDKIGVDVIDRVAGALLNERSKYGWSAAMIVSVHGFKKFAKYTSEDLVGMQINLRDKTDLTRWLKDYKSTPSGLLVPAKPSGEVPRF